MGKIRQALLTKAVENGSLATKTKATKTNKNNLPKQDVTSPQIDRVGLTPEEVVARYPELTRSVGVLANWRSEKKGPKYFKVNTKIVYRPRDIECFLFANPVLTIDSIE